MAHGRSEMTQTITAKGKHETRSWLEKRGVTIEDWQNHLEGKMGIGMPPLNSDNKVRWGAIDVDVYQGLSIESLNTIIQEKKLPLVLCRSKSGGPHIYLFVKDWVPATLMVDKLDSLAGFLGFGTSEIFPKQTSISSDGQTPDFGSWINMPYFGGTKFLRYALDPDNKALATIPAFIEYARSKSLSPEELQAFEPPASAELLPDGPPCLNQIMAMRPSDFRNVLLSNIAVYVKKAFPEKYADKMDEYNRLFETPLERKEVEAIEKSYSRKDYRYQCNKPPLSNYCNSSKCRKMKFGVGGGDTVMPATRSLSMITTAPPIWYMDLVLPDGSNKRISLTTEELQSPLLFQRRCMETIQQMPPLIKADEWHGIVGQLMQHCAKIEVSHEQTPEGQLETHLWEFLKRRASVGSMEDILRGVPYRDGNTYYFKHINFANYLNERRFIALKPNEVIAYIKNNLNAEPIAKKIAGNTERLLVITDPAPEQEQTLQVQTPNTAF